MTSMRAAQRLQSEREERGLAAEESGGGARAAGGGRPLPLGAGAPGRVVVDGSSGPVLFAVEWDVHAIDAPAPDTELLRAAVLARILDAELRVLRILPVAKPPAGARRGRGAKAPPARQTGTMEIDRATTEWARRVLGAGARITGCASAEGELVAQAALYAERTHARLIVVPRRLGAFGRSVTALACATGVPVLVARPSTGDETIVAATDLEDARFPVLHRAAELGRRLHAPVVAVHNANPRAVAVGGEPGALLMLPVGRPERADRGARLASAVERVLGSATRVLRTEDDPVDAILREARERDADLVVVGARPRSWVGRLLRRSVAAQLVDRAQRSVLVTPIDSGRGAPAGHEPVRA